jgi:hypothetical protein
VTNPHPWLIAFASAALGAASARRHRSLADGRRGQDNATRSQYRCSPSSESAATRFVDTILTNWRTEQQIGPDAVTVGARMAPSKSV